MQNCFHNCLKVMICRRKISTENDCRLFMICISHLVFKKWQNVCIFSLLFSHPFSRARRTKPFLCFMTTVFTPGEQASDSSAPPMMMTMALPTPASLSMYSRLFLLTGNPPVRERDRFITVLVEFPFFFPFCLNSLMCLSVKVNTYTIYETYVYWKVKRLHTGSN